MSNIEIQPGEASPALVTESQGSRDQAGNHPNRHFRLRNSCDRCQDTKLKCSQEKPACRRCARLGLPCVYSPIRRLGRPRKHSSNQLDESTQQRQQQPRQQRQPPPPPPSSSTIQSSGVAGANGGGHDENHEGEVTNMGQSHGGPSTSTSLQKVPTPAFHETISPFTDAFLDAMSGGNDEVASTIVIPSALHQPVIDNNHQFDVVMETLFTTDPASSESLAAVSLTETTFEDLQNWATEPSHYNTPVDQHEQFGSEALTGTTKRPSSSTINMSESGAAAAVTAVSDVFGPEETSMHFHTQSLPVSTSSLTSSSLMCSNDCYRCLSQQLAGLNSLTNSSVAPNVDTILQIDRNMQALTKGLLNCPHCLANDSSLLLLSIIMDQATRLLDCFIEKVKPNMAAVDHQGSIRGGSGGSNKNTAGESNTGAAYQSTHRGQPSASGVGLGKLYIPAPAGTMAAPYRKQSLIHTTELRIGDYEVLDEDLKLIFLKRLVRHRLRILVGMLTDLQNTTGGHMKEMQCSATLGMLRGVMERVERLRGKMSIKW
ncbi:hypothetical protein CFIO01_03280 [Colletotrichum fioriniae PJ7]|uniref:Zn(2)-C6 fungal-type domain-containing protein n=1 Tax=Colletotrichum fioriniae PJ7 TaxID=1445577 RepID=A0A010S3K2_9PEZI|nr:hypothetical protein CFIO01_03280 [Colletotrichum fioriniae PJ7]